MDGPISRRLLDGDEQAFDLFVDKGQTVTVYVEYWKGRKLLWLRSLSGRWYRVADYSSLPPETAELWGYISTKATFGRPISSEARRSSKR